MKTLSTQRIAMALAAGADLVASLTACVPLVVGGAAAAGVGMVATDRRSSGAQVDDQAIELRASAAGVPLQPVSAAGPWPSRQETGMPCMLPLGLVVSVLTSVWASSQSTRSFLPCSVHQRATAVIEPMARQ